MTLRLVTLRSLAMTAIGFTAFIVQFVIGTTALAAEKVNIAIISFSPYAPWYIVKEKGLAKDIELEIQLIEDITAKNAAVSSGTVQCILNTLDSVVVARAADVPLKVVTIPAMSYGLDEMVVSEGIGSVEEFSGKSFGADYAFLNHMWMLLTLKKAGIEFDQLSHKIMLPQESAAAFVSGALDIDVNYIPFSKQSLERDGSHVLKTSLTDRTWERGLISESIACNEDWLKAKPEVAKELLRAWFEAVNWWKENPDEGNEIIAKGLDWPIEDVKLTQYGAIMLTLDQNLGAFGLGNGKPVCASIPEGARQPPAEPSGWGEELFGGEPDCAAGYLGGTWDLFGSVYQEAGVIDTAASAEKGLDTSILEVLFSEGYGDQYNSNKWIGRVGE
ncbi:MAG: ABC transporter substrate-binding protein [Gammaproteobacteria bacterium]|nr:ABC transporter substrate-binding protein [Gammaproteobacteria bacterium]